MNNSNIPDQATIYGWIEEIFGWGIRRPGYPADRQAEAFILSKFQQMGLENVRKEPVTLPYWEPLETRLVVVTDTESFEIPCFPLPHTKSAKDLDLELATFDPLIPSNVRNKAALNRMPLMSLPPTMIVDGGAATPGVEDMLDLELNSGGVVIDPRETFKDSTQVLPFSAALQSVMEPSMVAGAAAFIGVLTDYPGNSYQYYVPYDAIKRNIPGVWIRGSDGEVIAGLMEKGTVRIKLNVNARREEITCYNIVGELSGADAEMVVIGSHHDGPWSSAVEDASGISLVLAQASYWSGVSQEERPHRLVFLVNAGHMAGGAGCAAFIQAHEAELGRIVLELHLEHTAKEYALKDDKLVATGEPETRWFFTSENQVLKQAVVDALRAENLDRSLVIAPDAFGERPTTDGGAFYGVGVPLVNYLTAPFYLFDPMDGLDKIHTPSLEPITRWAIRMVEFTKGLSAATMREGISGGGA